MRGEPASRIVEPVVIFIQDAVAVDADDVADAFGQQQLTDRDTSGAHAEHHHANVLHLLTDHSQRVEQRRVDDRRRAVLVIVKDRYVEQLT